KVRLRRNCALRRVPGRRNQGATPRGRARPANPARRLGYRGGDSAVGPRRARAADREPDSGERTGTDRTGRLRRIGRTRPGTGGRGAGAGGRATGGGGGRGASQRG